MGTKLQRMAGGLHVVQLSLTPRETASETIENPDIVKIGKARTGNGDRRKQLENPGKQQKTRSPYANCGYCRWLHKQGGFNNTHTI